MRYVSLDIETTSLEPGPDNILMLSMVIEDTNRPDVPVEELPHFTCYIKNKEPIQGSYFALAMNSWILDVLSGRAKDVRYKVLTNYDAKTETENLYWVRQAQDFLKQHFPTEKRITVAGKNVAGFDMKFMPLEISNLFKHKVIDPAMFYWLPETDTELPSLGVCKERAHLMTPVTHDAREDAMDVIQLIRKAIQS